MRKLLKISRVPQIKKLDLGVPGALNPWKALTLMNKKLQMNRECILEKCILIKKNSRKMLWKNVFWNLFLLKLIRFYQLELVAYAAFKKVSN